MRPPAGRNALVGRYLSVGAICAVAHNAIMIGGDFIHAFYAVSFAFSFATVTLLGYILHVRYTFATRTSWRGFWRFTGANLAGSQISFGLTALFISGLGLRPLLAAPLVTLLLFFWNFAATHWALLAPRATLLDARQGSKYRN